MLFSLPGCSRQIQKQVQSFSSTCRNAVSQLGSSLNTASQALFETVSSGKPSSGRPSSPASPASRVAAVTTKKSAVASNRGKTDVKSVKKISSGLPASSTPKKTVPANYAPSSNYPEMQHHADYQSLGTEAERELYRQIGQSVYQIAFQKSSSGYYPVAQISCSGSISEAQIRVAMLAYMDDNPQVFWLADVYGFGTHDGRTILQLYSVVSPDECSASIKQLDSAVSSVIRSIPSGLSEFDREEYLFNYIVGRCTYDNAAVTDTSRWQAFTSYGVIVNGTAVCEGYSRAMQLLAGYAGLNCTLVRGSSGGVGHMWNQVEVGGAWYHLDLTWCDNSILIYNYYNITDSIISQTHQIGPSVSELSEEQIDGGLVQYNLSLHACNSTEANYFKYKGIPVTAQNGSDDAQIIGALSEDLKQGKRSIAFYIGGDYNSTVSGIVSGKLSVWLSAAEKRAGKSLGNGSTKYVTDQADKGMTIQVSYR